MPNAPDKKLKPLKDYLAGLTVIEDDLTEIEKEYASLSGPEVVKELREVTVQKHEFIRVDDYFAAHPERDCPLGKTRKPLRISIRDCDLRIVVLMGKLIESGLTALPLPKAA